MTKPQAPVGERDGEWQLVPKEATQEMIDAIASDSEMQVVSNQNKSFREIWRALLAAAPSPPPEPTVDTTKLNAGQLVQRIMRAMDGDVSSFTTASLAEYIAAEILKLPKDYWRKPPPETRAEDWRSGSLATYRGGIASAALTNRATYVVNAIILAHGAKYLQIITNDKTVRDLLSTHFTNTTSTEPPAAGAGERNIDSTEHEAMRRLEHCAAPNYPRWQEDVAIAVALYKRLATPSPDAARPSVTEEEILRAAKVAFEVDWPKDDWTRFKVGDHARERYINMARAILALPLNPAATSEGGE